MLSSVEHEKILKPRGHISFYMYCAGSRCIPNSKYDKQNLALLVISYEKKIMKLAKGSFHKFHMKW